MIAPPRGQADSVRIAPWPITNAGPPDCRTALAPRSSHFIVARGGENPVRRGFKTWNRPSGIP